MGAQLWQGKGHTDGMFKGKTVIQPAHKHFLCLLVGC